MKGTHGTCRSRSDTILKSGFSAYPGLRGNGAYFWAYKANEQKEYCRKLAKAWWSYSNNRGSYSAETDKSCSVVFASFEVRPDDILDLENLHLRERFISFYEVTSKRLTDASKENEQNTDANAKNEMLSKIYDMFIRGIELRTKKNYPLIHVKVQRPKKIDDVLPLDVTGQPSCLVAREVTCIKVEDVSYED